MREPRLRHKDPAQNVKNRWAVAVGETPTHWLTVIVYQQGGKGTIVHALPKADYEMGNEDGKDTVDSSEFL